MIINKVFNFIFKNKPRVTFNYSRIYKDLLGIFLNLSSKIYNNLLNL